MKALHIIFFVGICCSLSAQQRSTIDPPRQEKNLNCFQAKIFKNALPSELESPLSVFLSLDPLITEKKYKELEEEFNSFCEKLSNKQSKNKGDRYLEHIFYTVHKKYLKQYELNSPLYTTLEKGNYDCVSGTALYALILDRLSIPYTIKETKFHVYLLANYRNKTYLFESTDPIGGYISDGRKIKESEARYLKEEEKNKNYYVFSGVIDEEINLTELAALEYYNQGILNYNNKNILASLDYFEKALNLYHSNRIEEIFRMSLRLLEKEIKYSESIGLAQSYQYYSKVITR